MALVVCDGGELIALKALVNNTAQSTNLTLKLYKSDTTPGNTDTAGTYTEADFTGYSAATLTGASWVVTGNPVTYAKQTFTSSAGSQNQNVYGYFIVAGAALIYSERFSDGPYNIANDGDKIEVTPSLGAD
jgi:hypothetical protein